ncbi:hypothetical protein FEM48_Zijuj08G0160900 [Ziziphus jujuba var. spinosa]|uniref:C-CAP/cofactor C-like domain-containing protein n=1 Tax=Ziziphus jujuba var. spinosa TaxID=714518 RepID=A0A978V021_ZIZJJ|nr:tubulin-folding cofactor C [Ziziphus jujuba var. spinosa]KAH7520587.1 hypothetical protein FEM48_Zijuj08G0160900 [Ziziphus jujuba var. spinosa]
MPILTSLGHSRSHQKIQPGLSQAKRESVTECATHSRRTMEDEEESLSSSSNPNHLHSDSKTLDPALQKKHASMLERLANRHQTRLDNSLTRRSADSDSSSSPLESTSSFLSHFADSKRSIEEKLAQCRLTPTSDSAEVKTRLDCISSSISNLEKLVAEKSYFLPSYEVRSSLKTISDLKQSLDILNAELIPRKKFSFRNKAAKKEQVIDPKKDTVKEKEVEIRKPEKTAFAIPESPGFRNKTGELLVSQFKGSEIGEFTISDLDSCEVRLLGCVRALFIHRLRKCRIYVGPVMGSILIDGVEECVFVMASHQIRIHNAKASDFYLRVRSRPIIEDSSSVRFAPYCLSYEGIDRDLKEASLDEETGNWANVDDFRWLRAVQSPNWSVLPEAERVRIVKISNSDSRAEEC